MTPMISILGVSLKPASAAPAVELVEFDGQAQLLGQQGHVLDYLIVAHKIILFIYYTFFY
jgi:hypothetical protein